MNVLHFYIDTVGQTAKVKHVYDQKSITDVLDVQHSLRIGYYVHS